MLAGWQQDLPGDDSDYEELTSQVDAGLYNIGPDSDTSVPLSFVENDPTFDRDLLPALDHDQVGLLLKLLDHPDYVGRLNLEDIIYVAIQKRGPNCLEALIKVLGRTPSKRYELGRTLLHHAVHRGAVGCLEILMEHLGEVALIDAESEEQESPLCTATKLGRIHCVDTLLRHGANPNARHLLLNAALNDDDDAELMERLIAAGADVNMPCEGYVSLLGAATARGNLNIMTTLIDHGAKVNEVGSSEHSAAYGTPLCTAVVRASVTAVDLLLRRGANVSLAGPRGDPLTIAQAELKANPSTSDVYARIIELLEAAMSEVSTGVKAESLEEPHAATHADGVNQDGGGSWSVTAKTAKTQFKAGDIVYVPRQEPNHLRYVKCFYVRSIGQGDHSVQDWKMQERFVVREPDIVGKTSLSAGEVAMAEAFDADTTLPFGDEVQRIENSKKGKPANATAGMLDTGLIDRRTMALLLARADKLLEKPPSQLEPQMAARFQDALGSPATRTKIVAGKILDVMSCALYAAGFEAIDSADLDDSLLRLDTSVLWIMGLLALGFVEDAGGLDVAEGARMVSLLQEEQSRLLAKHNPDRRYGLLRFAAECGDPQTIEMIVRLGVDVNTPIEHGNTALHYAATAGHASVAKRLLELGALLDPVNVSKSYHSISTIDSLLTHLGTAKPVHSVNICAHGRPRRQFWRRRIAR